MKIAIDTSRDPPESIRKVIRLLHDLVNEPYANFNPPESPVSDDVGILNLFGQGSSPSASVPLGSASSDAGTSPSVFDIFKNDSPPRHHSDEEDTSDDGEERESLPVSKPLLKLKDSDPRAKKFQFPEDQISIIEY